MRKTRFTEFQIVKILKAAEGAGRVLIGQLFVVSGLYKIGNFAGVAARMTGAVRA